MKSSYPTRGSSAWLCTFLGPCWVLSCHCVPPWLREAAWVAQFACEHGPTPASLHYYAGHNAVVHPLTSPKSHPPIFGRDLLSTFTTSGPNHEHILDAIRPPVTATTHCSAIAFPVHRRRR
ncbi:hypothetical protein V8F33_013876 [Rhypophila sp. PSN 637]